MARHSSGAPDQGLLSRAALPVFSTFFIWGFGTGALWMVRPLFAYSLGGSLFLVGLVSAFSAAPRMFGAPIAGSLADRIGRRPVVVTGALAHGAAVALQAQIDSYLPFLLLEFISGFGVAVWVTGTAALLADFTRVSNRGRGVALRNTAQRLGILSGPAAGGLIAQYFDLQAVFLFIAATKVIIILITIFLIKETRQKGEPAAQQAAARHPRVMLPDVSIFRTRAFLTLGIVTLALGLVANGPGAFRTFFPVQAEEIGLSLADVGMLISASGLAAMLVAIPVGALTDWTGRKPVLLGGLVLTAASLALVLGMQGLFIAFGVAIAFGVGEAVWSNTVQTYAMDLAPKERRGYFLGTWQATLNVGQLAGPLLIGALAAPFGLPVIFAATAATVLLAGGLLAILGTETLTSGDEIEAT